MHKHPFLSLSLSLSLDPLLLVLSFCRHAIRLFCSSEPGQAAGLWLPPAAGVDAALQLHSHAAAGGAPGRQQKLFRMPDAGGQLGQTGRSKSSVAMALYSNMFCNVTGICLLLQSRPTLVLAQCAGDTAAMAARLSSWSAGVGVLEFLLNPMAGKLSDSYGRRFFLLASPVINLVLKAAVAATAGRSLLALMLERVVNGAVTTLAGSTMCSTMLSDLYSGADLSRAYASLGSAAGAGAVIGSFLAGRISARGYSAAAVFWAAAALSAAQLALNLAVVPEVRNGGARLCLLSPQTDAHTPHNAASEDMAPARGWGGARRRCCRSGSDRSS
jgi:MFS family permease